jgi:hypothetical protein
LELAQGRGESLPGHGSHSIFSVLLAKAQAGLAQLQTMSNFCRLFWYPIIFLKKRKEKRTCVKKEKEKENP